MSEGTYLHITMNHVVVMTIAECLQNLPHVMAAQTGSRMITAANYGSV